MPPLPKSPLPTPVPSPRRPPVPAGLLRAVAVLSVIGLAYVLSRSPGDRRDAGETPAITFDPSIPSPLIRAATPLADGFALPAETPLAVATGTVIEADPARGTVRLLHKFRDGVGTQRYFESSYHDVRGLFVAVGDPVARAQKLAEAASREVSISEFDEDMGKKAKISIQEFLRKRPSLASPGYAIPPFSPHGGGQLPVFSQPRFVPQPPSDPESP